MPDLQPFTRGLLPGRVARAAWLLHDVQRPSRNTATRGQHRIKVQGACHMSPSLTLRAVAAANDWEWTVAMHAENLSRPSAPGRVIASDRRWQPASMMARSCRQPGVLSTSNAVALGPRTQAADTQAVSTAPLTQHPSKVQRTERGGLPPWLL